VRDQSTCHILGIAGSLRKGSYNRALLRAAREVAPDGVTIEIFDIGDIPLYNGDIEAQGLPEPVQHFVDRIHAADAILLATPEYNHSVPGVLKNAIDWVSRASSGNPLRHKPLAMMGASGGQFGTVRAQEAWRLVFASGVDPFVMVNPQLLVNHAAQKFDQQGELIDDDTRNRLTGFIEAFIAWSRRVQGFARVSL
jgi:chromate reductase